MCCRYELLSVLIKLFQKRARKEGKQATTRDHGALDDDEYGRNVGIYETIKH
jgi:hypothetical protein